MRIPMAFDSHGDTVRGTLHLAERNAAARIVALLGGFPDDNEDDVLELGERLSQHAITALTFNYRGTHRSAGTFSFAHTLQDIEAAVTYLLEHEQVAGSPETRADRLVLVGISYGGGMALTYAARHPDARHIVSIAGTDHGEMVRAYLRDASLARRLDAWFEGMQFPAGPVHFQTTLQEELLEDRDVYDLRLSAPALADRDILIIGGWDDLWISLEDHLLPLYRALVAAGARRVQLTAVRDDHHFQRSQGPIADMIVQWISALPDGEAA